MKLQNATLKKKPAFFPVVLDEKGTIRKRFDSMHCKTRIEKRALASKIFEIGLDVLERSAMQDGVIITGVRQTVPSKKEA